MTDDPINHPKHYQLPNGLEVIQITEHCDFLTGNIIKYLLRAGNKDGNTKLQDLKKAEWYLKRAIENEEKIVEMVVKEVERRDALTRIKGTCCSD